MVKPSVVPRAFLEAQVIIMRIFFFCVLYTYTPWSKPCPMDMTPFKVLCLLKDGKSLLVYIISIKAIPIFRNDYPFVESARGSHFLSFHKGNPIASPTAL
mgnify:CR=1 FL=1